MPNPIVPNQAERNQLGLLLGAGEGAPYVKLYSAIASPMGANTVLTDFTECTYSGYMAQSPTWGTVATDVSGNAYSDSTTITFPVALSSSQTALGWFLTSFGGLLIMCREFDTPVTVTTLAGVSPFVIRRLLRQIP